MRLIERLKALERSGNTAPMLVLEVDTAPTCEQSALIDRCTKTGRQLIVFCTPGDSAWMPGCGVPPWEITHDNA